MIDTVSRLAGILLVVVTFMDIFLTVLYPRSGQSLFSLSVSKSIWSLFKTAVRILPIRNQYFLSLCGPTVVVAIVFIWVLLYVLGFALFLWPALGSGIQASSGPTPTDFFHCFLLQRFYVYDVRRWRPDSQNRVLSGADRYHIGSWLRGFYGHADLSAERVQRPDPA